VTAVSTSLLLVLAFAIAVARVRSHTIVARLASTLASLPIGVPGVLIGVGLLWAYIRTPLYATVAILVLVMLARFLPVIVRMFETALMQVDRSLEESAAICGASPLRVTWHVRLPLLAGTMRSALMVGTSQVFNELTASALLFTATSSVLPVVVFNYMFDGDYARASACALLQVVILIALFAAVTFVARGRAGARVLAA
jgi:iron(III) transport system permease protein